MATAPHSNEPLFRFNRDRNAVIDEVVERITRDALQRAWDDPSDGLGYLLNEAAYVEMALHESDPTSTKADVEHWQRVAQSLGRSSEEENAESLRAIVVRFTHEIVGHFRPTVFKLATEMVPSGLSMLLNPLAKRGILSDTAGVSSLRDRLRIEGEVGKLRALAEAGTLVFVPTHSSHLDSIAVSWAIHQARLPAVVYGAAKNQFTHPLMAFFMANLGAYKVDRRRSYRLYNRVLKAYSQVLLERGYHSLFFPSGMRSRSHRVEQELKLGLLSTAVEAYARNVVGRKSSRRIYIVPVTVNYPLVLEAETLIEDALAERLDRRPIIEDDEFSDVRRIASYAKALLAGESSIVVRFCTPMDVFGNAVDQDGQSVDAERRRVDPERYLWVRGEPAEDRERERAYTRQLAGRVSDAYRENNVVHPIHIVSMAVMQHLRRQHATWDERRLVRFARGESVSSAVAEGETERLARLLRRDHEDGTLRLSRRSQTLTARQMIEEALKSTTAFHSRPMLIAEGQRLRAESLELLLFYSNRLRGYDLIRRLRAVPGGY
ncbi:MAG: glycerol-3-phosphate O-acyltransferase [Bradymonadia bacterium]